MSLGTETTVDVQLAISRRKSVNNTEKSIELNL